MYRRNTSFPPFTFPVLADIVKGSKDDEICNAKRTETKIETRIIKFYSFSVLLLGSQYNSLDFAVDDKRQ